MADVTSVDWRGQCRPEPSGGQHINFQEEHCYFSQDIAFCSMPGVELVLDLHPRNIALFARRDLHTGDGGADRIHRTHPAGVSVR